MFELTEEQKMVSANAHRFWLKEIDPIIDERERRAAKGEVFSREEIFWLRGKLDQMGYGDEELSHVSHGLLREEQGYFWVSTSTVGFGSDGFRLLERMTPECRQKYVGRLKDMLGAGGMSESNAGGSPMPSFTEFKSVLDGDFWICNGTKNWVMGSGGAISDYMTCTTLIDRGNGVEGMGNIFIDRHESPFQTREMPRLGWRCCSFAEVSFTDCKVPRENMLIGGRDGEEGRVGFGGGRAGFAALATGLGQACVDASTKYVQETKRWGKPLASFQLIQNMLVNMAVETDCSRYLYLRAFDAADRLEKGETLTTESSARDPLRLYSSMAKYFCCEAANRTAYDAVSIHGALGIVDDLRIERYYRDARVLTFPGGTSEIQRLIVGRELTSVDAIR